MIIRKNALAQGAIVLFIIGILIGAALIFYEPQDPSDNLLELFGLAAIFAPMLSVAGAALFVVALAIGERSASTEELRSTVAPPARHEGESDFEQG